MKIPDFIQVITALCVAWQSWETNRLNKLTRIKDQPFIEVYFPKLINGQINGKLIIKNLGQSPAYSISIGKVSINDNEFMFDPNKDTRESLLPMDSREIWVHCISNGKSILNSLGVLVNMVYSDQVKNNNIKLFLKYHDKDGVELKRTLYLKVGGGDAGVQYLYTTTSI